MNRNRRKYSQLPTAKEKYFRLTLHRRGFCEYEVDELRAALQGPERVQQVDLPCIWLTQVQSLASHMVLSLFRVISECRAKSKP